MNEIGFGSAAVGIGLIALVSLVWQFGVQVAATLVALWIWDRLRRRRAG